MTLQRGSSRTRNTVVAALLVAAVALTIVPSGLSFSGGIGTGDAGYDAEGEHPGCTSCHGGGTPVTTIGDPITVSITDGDTPISGAYHAGTAYTITITLDEQITGGSNAAGFNLFVDAGTLEAGTGSRITDSGEATHVDGSLTEWTVTWAAPDEGPATFRLFVNDVDGSGAPDAGDDVHYRLFSIPDEEFAMPGAVEEEEPHVGVPLPQYWLGLIALATMLVVILFAYVYLKYSSPSNTDQKDR